MKYIALLIFFIIGGLFLVSRLQTPNQEQTTLSTQTNSEGSVTVEITPEDVSGPATSWRFKVVLNTHTDELVSDLTKTVALKDDKGTVYQPNAWEGTPPGGHHREGTLFFNPISPRPNKLVLLVRDIGSITERSFSWEIGRR